MDRFRRRRVTLAAAAETPYRSVDWRDALVLIEQGELELVGERGGRCRFVTGDILCLVGLPLVALHNPGDAPLVLTVVSRRLVPDVGESTLGHMARSRVVHTDESPADE